MRNYEAEPEQGKKIDKTPILSEENRRWLKMTGVAALWICGSFAVVGGGCGAIKHFTGNDTATFVYGCATGFTLLFSACFFLRVHEIWPFDGNF